MPVPIILGAAALAATAAGAVVNKASQEVAMDIRSELNDIIEEINYISSRSKRKAEKSQSRLKDSLDNLVKIKEDIYSSTLFSFVNEVNDIKNIDLPDNISDDFNVPKLSFEVNECKMRKKRVDYTWSETSSVVAANLIVGSVVNGLAVFGSMMDFVSTYNKMDEAKAELAKAKAQYEKIKIQCAAIDTISEFYNIAASTIINLNSVLAQSVKEISAIKSQYGSDYISYPISVKSQLRNIMNIAYSVYSLLKFEYISSDGMPVLAVINNNRAFIKSNEFNFSKLSNALETLQ